MQGAIAAHLERPALLPRQPIRKAQVLRYSCKFCPRATLLFRVFQLSLCMQATPAMVTPPKAPRHITDSTLISSPC